MGEFDTTTRHRGEQVWAESSVVLLEVDQEGAYAQVQGSADEPYDVELEWPQPAHARIKAFCSCPRFADGHLCKHIWATIRDIDAKEHSVYVSGTNRLKIDAVDEEELGSAFFEGEAMGKFSNLVDSVTHSGRPPGIFPVSDDSDDDDEDDDEFEDDDDFDEEDDDEDDDDEDDVEDADDAAGDRTRRPNAEWDSRYSLGRSPDRVSNAFRPPPKQQTPKSEWQRALESIEAQRAMNQDDDNHPSWGARRQRERLAWYVINVADSARQGCLVIDLMQQERMKNGGFGKIKRLSYQSRLASEFAEPLDRRLLQQLEIMSRNAQQATNYYYYHRFDPAVTSVQLPAAMQDMILPELCATGRCVWVKQVNQPCQDAPLVTWDAGDSWTFELVVKCDDAKQHWNLMGQFRRGEDTCAVHQATLYLPSGLALIADRLCRTHTASDAWSHWLHRNRSIAVPYSEGDTFLRQLWESPHVPPLVLPENLPLACVREAPQPRLCVRPPERRFGNSRDMVGEIEFLYSGIPVKMNNTSTGIVPPTGDESDAGPVRRVLLRDHEAEKEYWNELLRLPVVASRDYSQRSDLVHIKSQNLPGIVAHLIARGWAVEADGKHYRTAGNFEMQVQSGIDWFDLHAQMDFDGVSASLPNLLAAVRRGQNYIELGDGTFGLLPEAWVKRFSSLADLGASTDGTVRFSRSQALLLDALLAEQEHLRLDEPFAAYRERLRSFAGVEALPAPATFQGTLRDYQRHGLGWFHFLDELSLGGCLADDMGLGKTIQVLAMLELDRTKPRDEETPHRPSLVVVPKSLVFNWIDEAQRFTPQLQVHNYTGLQRAAVREDMLRADVIVTTYGTLRRDIVDLKDTQFNYVILDEAQAIKNSASQMAKASRLLKARRRLALTGTPIENHLGELWSLFEFLNPGMLGRSSAFAALCKSAKDVDHDSLSQLARAIAPFVLRRTKDQVLKELPEKTEQTLFCELSPRERQDYDQLKNYYRAQLSSVIDTKGLEKSKIHVLEALLRLRQAACHPGLIDKKKVNASSAKIELLLEQLQEVIGEGHKALVFSQFTSLLAIVKKKLDEAGIRYEYLDGQTQKRKAVVERFQSPQGSPVFLISLKAGGHGLNLTAADYVYILDPWWNPAVEMQAIDRTHRIGQTRRVFAYRIIASDTVEEKVLALQESKRELADAIITANDSLIRRLTADDLQVILS
jgi:superfamily II DNA or RNA helicase